MIETIKQMEGINGKESLYYTMIYLRYFEDKIISLYPEQEIKTPVHLGIGQEAVAIGCLYDLRYDDYVYSNHRGHLHYLAKGGDPFSFAAELYGKESGCARGRGGSMHLVDENVGLMGSSAIVSGGVPIATGAALGFKFQGKNNVAVTFIGDGAMDEGVVYESMAFAALKKLAVIFVVENNGYATASSISNRQLLDNIWKRGEVFGVEGKRVDGNDVMAVREAVGYFVEKARAGEGPGLIECMTYRWKGHVGTAEDTGYRTKDEIERWKARCPLKIMEEKYNVEPDENLLYQIHQEIDVLFERAKEEKDPDPSTLVAFTQWEVM